LYSETRQTIQWPIEKKIINNDTQKGYTETRISLKTGDELH